EPSRPIPFEVERVRAHQAIAGEEPILASLSIRRPVAVLRHKHMRWPAPAGKGRTEYPVGVRVAARHGDVDVTSPRRRHYCCGERQLFVHVLVAQQRHAWPPLDPLPRYRRHSLEAVGAESRFSTGANQCHLVVAFQGNLLSDRLEGHLRTAEDTMKA